ncbi:MAG: translocation/assembly module TamB domain-containing protein [Bacteroidota bacterium]
MKFIADELLIENTTGHYFITKDDSAEKPAGMHDPGKQAGKAFAAKKPLPADTADTAATQLTIGIKKGDLKMVSVVFRNLPAKQIADARINNLSLRKSGLDLATGKYNFGDLGLENSYLSFHQGKMGDTLKTDLLPDSVGVTTKPDTHAVFQGFTLDLNAKSVTLKNNTLRYDDDNAAPQNRGMNYFHISATRFSTAIKNMRMNADSLVGKIESLTFNEQCGFTLNKAGLQMRMNNKKVELQNMLIETPDSRIAGNYGVSYKSFGRISENIGLLGLAVHPDSTHIAVKDVLIFAPDLATQPIVKQNLSTTLNMHGRIDGQVRNLKFTKFHVHLLDQTLIQLDGTIKGLPEPDKIWADTKIARFTTSRKNIHQILPKAYIPTAIEIPETISLAADFKGTVKDFKAFTDAKTSMGNAVVHLKMWPVGKTSGYDADANVQHFQLGRFLKQPQTMGALTLNAKAKGSGLDLETIDADVNARVVSFEFQKYNYRNLLVDGNIKKMLFRGKIDMNDPNLVLAFKGKADMDPKHPGGKFVLNLKKADLVALHLSPDVTFLQTKIVANMQGRNLDELTGKLKVKEINLTKGAQTINVDSIVLTAARKDGKANYELRSEILKADLKGHIEPSTLGDAILNHVKRYYDMDDTPVKILKSEQAFEFNMEILNTDLITALVPDLRKFKPGSVSMTFNSVAHTLTATADLPQITYTNYTVNNLKFDLKSDNDKMVYGLKTDDVSDSTNIIRNPSIAGMVSHNVVTCDFVIPDEKKKKVRFRIGGSLAKNKEVQRFHLFNKTLVLQGRNFDVDSANYIEFGDQILYANNVGIRDKDESITVNSGSRSMAKPDLNVDFKNFDLSFISDIIKADEKFIAGILDGRLTIAQTKPSLIFTSDLKITDFAFKADTLGIITIKADNKTQGKYAMDMRIEGHGNDVRLAGDYMPDDSINTFDLNLKVTTLNLATVESYTAGNLKYLHGNLLGAIALKGSINKPQITGALHFDDARFNLVPVNAYFLLRKETITFERGGIRLNNFTIADSNGHNAVINGNVKTLTYRDFGYEINMKAENFLLMNTSFRDNKTVYGKMLMGCNAHIRDIKGSPQITGQLRIGKGTALTYILSNGEPATVEHDGIVEFVAPDTLTHLQAESLKNAQKAKEAASTAFNIDIQMDISIDRNARFTVIMDQASGDKLEVEGGGNLNFGMDPSGKISLSGVYTLQGGSYNLSFYSLVQRKFLIKKGSTVSWNGDPMDADVNITAVYQAKTSPGNLLNDQIADLSAEDRNKYKQKIPFNVELYITGKIFPPSLGFGINLPDNYKQAYSGAVDARLQQLNGDPNSLNQQVFSLLIFGSFMASNPALASASGGGGIGETARSSVSQVLSDQLEGLSNQYIKGVNLDVGVDSYQDYSTGAAQNRTQVNLGVSKNLLNDRLTVSVGSAVDVEGNRAGTVNNGAGYMPGNVTVEYSLTPTGQLKLKGYRSVNTVSVIDNNVTETRVAIAFTRDFNKWRAIFKKDKAALREVNQ